MQVQIRDAGKEETALVVYWVTDGVDRCQVGFVPWHLVKHMGKYNGALVQKMDVYSAADDSNYRRQKILACDRTKEAEEEMFNATTSKENTTTSKEYTKKETRTLERKDQ